MGFRGLVFSLLLLPAFGVAAQASEPAPAPVAEAVPASAAAAEPAVKKNADPWEKFNRRIFAFNDSADRYVLKPVAKGYVFVTPRFLRTGVTNFFINLRSPIVILNDALQGKLKQAGSDTARFVVNSTVGVAGLIDVAVHWNMPLHDEDFGQTLGKWGMNSGPYLILPLMAPSTVRDTGGFVVDAAANPRRYLIEDEAVDWALTGLDIVSSRASLLELEGIVQGDRYLFIRDLYLQRREFSVQDGQVADPFLDGEDYQEDEVQQEAEQQDEEVPGAPVAEAAPAAPAEADTASLAPPLSGLDASADKDLPEQP